MVELFNSISLFIVTFVAVADIILLEEPSPSPQYNLKVLGAAVSSVIYVSVPPSIYNFLAIGNFKSELNSRVCVTKAADVVSSNCLTPFV